MRTEQIAGHSQRIAVVWLLTNLQAGAVGMVGISRGAVGHAQIFGPVTPERQWTVSLASSGGVESKQPSASWHAGRINSRGRVEREEGAGAVLHAEVAGGVERVLEQIFGAAGHAFSEDRISVVGARTLRFAVLGGDERVVVGRAEGPAAARQPVGVVSSRARGGGSLKVFAGLVRQIGVAFSWTDRNANSISRRGVLVPERPDCLAMRHAGGGETVSKVAPGTGGSAGAVQKRISVGSLRTQ